MIDLETMSTKPDAAIVSIGAVEFGPDFEQIGDPFYTPISLHSCKTYGLHIEQSTVDWWAAQPAETRAHWEVADAPDLTDGLKAFQDWLWSRAGNRKNVCPWGNGADFDMVITRNGFNAVGAEEPWMFYNVHCFRTVKNMYPLSAGEVPARSGAHRADADAVYQLDYLRAIARKNLLVLP